MPFEIVPQFLHVLLGVTHPPYFFSLCLRCESFYQAIFKPIKAVLTLKISLLKFYQFQEFLFYSF